MALTVIATPGATNANSYCTVAEAAAYHAARLHSTWDNVADKEASLINATRLLDAIYEWAEYPTTETQALQWPRTGILGANRLTYVGSMSIPDQLKWATAEFAMQLDAADRTADSDIEAQGLTGLTAGPVSLQFSGVVKGKVVPDAAASLLPAWWGKIIGKGMTAEVERT